MKNLLLIALLFWSAGIASATAYNTQQSGNWNVASTWTTGACGTNTAPAVPGSGDTVTICAHTVTIPAGVTAVVGASGATDTVAITMHTTGGVLKNQGTLNLQGNIDWTLGQIILDQDSATVFVTPAGAQYRIRENGGTGPLTFTVAGVAGHYASIDSSGLGTNGWLDLGSTSGIGVNVSASFLKINHCGDTTNGCLMQVGCGSFGCTTFAIDHVLSQNSAKISSTASSNGAVVQTINGLTIINPLGMPFLRVRNDTAPTSGSCSQQNIAIYNNAAVRSVDMWAKGCTWSNLVGYNYTVDQTTTAINTTVTNAVMVIDDANLAATTGQFVTFPPESNIQWSNFVLYSHTANPHSFQEAGALGGLAANVISGGFCSGDAVAPGDLGDFVLPAGQMTAHHNILVNMCGTMFTGLQATDKLTFYNNTNYDNCGGSIGEGATSSATMLIRYQNNIISKPNTLCGTYQDGIHQHATGGFVRQNMTTSPDYNGFFAMPGSGDSGAATNYATQGKTATENLLNSTLGSIVSYVGGPMKAISAAFTGKVSTATTNTTQITYATGGFTAAVIAGDYGVRANTAVAPAYGSITSVPLDTQVNTNTITGMTTGQTFDIRLSYFSTAGAVYGTTANLGTHDIHANPNFTNAAFTLATYNSQNGGAGTIASFGALAAQLNGWDNTGAAVTFNTAYTPATILLAGQTAFTPHNAALKGTGSGGGDIGAVSVVAGCGSGIMLMGVGCN